MFSEHFSPLIKAIIEDTFPENHRGVSLFKDRETMIKQKLLWAEEFFKERLIYEAECFEKGFILINENLPHFLSPSELGKVKAECAAASEKVLNEKVALSYEENRELVSIHELLGISEETMDHFYTVAAMLFELQQYQEAEYVLKIAVFFCPFFSPFWLSLGLAQHALSKYMEAANSYSIAAFLDPDVPEPPYYLANVFCDMKEVDYAKIAYNECSELISRNHLSDEWSEKMSELFNKMNH